MIRLLVLCGDRIANICPDALPRHIFHLRYDLLIKFTAAP
jgi:hypothetical protein